MGRLITVLLTLAVGSAAALGLVSCGSGSDAKLLAGNTAKEITENLDAVKQLASEGECVSAEDAAQQVATQVDGLRGIDPKLKETLEQGAVKLQEVVEHCTEEEAEESEFEEDEEEPETTETEEEPKKKPQKTEKETAAPPAKEPKTEKETKPPSEPPEPPGHEAEAPPTHEEGGPPSGGIGPGAEATPPSEEGD
jgi:chemotaxis protein histidine kinase CheA